MSGKSSRQATSFLITGTNRLTKAKEFADLAVDISTIDEVRELERTIALGQSVIITNAQNLSAEAQNAFLKTLEEPQANIVLLAENEDQLLPTVVSRCIVIDLPIESVNLNVSDLLNTLRQTTDRGEAIKLLDQLLIARYKIRQLFKAKKYLLANTNVRLTLENILLDWYN